MKGRASIEERNEWSTDAQISDLETRKEELDSRSTSHTLYT